MTFKKALYKPGVGFILFMLTILRFTCLSVFSQTPTKDITALGKTPADFIPKGYTTLFSKKGDLNKDQKEDIVLVLKNMAEDKPEGIIKYSRILLILFKTDLGYRLAAKTEKLLLCNTCGFEPARFEESNLLIKNGSLMLSQHGGQTQQWTAARIFRYQDGDFYLIGKRDEITANWSNNPCENSSTGSSTDINLLTGDRIIIETDDDCKTTNKRDKIKRMPLVKMTDVDLNTELQ